MTVTLGCVLAIRDQQPHILERTLETYSYQTFLPTDRVLVDYGSESTVSNAYGQLGVRFGWRVVKPQRQPSEWHSSAAFNLAVSSLGSTDVVFKCEVGVLLGPNVLDAALRAGHEQLCVFACLVSEFGSADPAALAGPDDFFRWIDSLPLLTSLATECTHAFPRRWFESIGGYDLSFRGCGFEDSDLRERAKATIGVTIDRTTVLIRHGHPPSAFAINAAHNQALYERMKRDGPVVRNLRTSSVGTDTPYRKAQDNQSTSTMSRSRPNAHLRIAIATRSMNDHLIRLSDDLLHLDEGVMAWPPGTRRYCLSAHDSLDYFRELLSFDADWVVNLDEDAFVLHPNRIVALIEHMEVGGYAASGMPDGGVVAIRRHNPLACNAFFNVFDMRRVRRVWSDWQSVSNACHDPIYESQVPPFARRSMRAFDHFERYYGAFFSLLAAGERILYLNAEEWQDGVSTLLHDDNDAPLLLHTWYSRHWSTSHHTRQRIHRAYSFARQTQGLLFPDQTTVASGHQSAIASRITESTASSADPKMGLSEGSEKPLLSKQLEGVLLQSIPPLARRFLVLGTDAPALLSSLANRPDTEVTLIDQDGALNPNFTRIRVVQADLEIVEPCFERGEFDCIILPAMLPRFLDPMPVLRRLKNWLADAGCIMAVVPNVRHYRVLDGLFQGRWQPLDSPRQPMRYYTHREIEKLFFRSGFTLQELKPLCTQPNDHVHGFVLSVGSLRIEGLPAAETEEFVAESYLVKAAPGPMIDSGLTSIIVVTHNEIDYTQRCLDSLRLYTDEPAELIFVDNASTDGTYEYLQSLQGVTVIGNRTNVGFSQAVNQGIGAAKGRQILLLNNDTVVTTGWLCKLLEVLDQDSRVGLVGPCSNCVSGEQQVTVNYEDLTTLDGFAWQWSKNHLGMSIDTDRLVGFCLLIRRAVIDDIGLLDERFGIGCYEDDDYCLRAIQAGWRLVIARNVFIHHFGGRTFTGSGVDFGAIMLENRAKFDAKWQAVLSSPIAPAGYPEAKSRTALSGELNVQRSSSAGLAVRRGEPVLSLCMIVRNNAKTIEPALVSIRPWVDEMVVVDTGSTDETPAICARLGARVSFFPWVDDFSAARNDSIRHALGQWIFWMDSDDTISAECGQQLRALAYQQHPDNVMGFVVRVHCPGPEGDNTDITVVDHVKLVRNHQAIRFEGRIHEQLLPSIRRLGADVAWTDIYVTHSGYDHGPEAQSRKLDRDLRLLEMELADRPEHTFALFNMGMTLLDAGRFLEAADHLRRAIAVAQPEESHVRKAYALWTSAEERQGNWSAAWEICMQGLASFPLDDELRFRKGLLLQSVGRNHEAINAYQDLLTHREERHFTSVVSGIEGFKARHNLALALETLGDWDSAEAQWRTILVEKPHYQPAIQALAEAAIRQSSSLSQ